MRAVVFCDVADPWSFIGATRFERAAAIFSMYRNETVEIVYRAAVAPQETDLTEAMRPAKITGIELNRHDLVAADSTDAWRLITWASSFMPTAQRDLIWQLWRAQFLEGADISDPLVLSGRAALAGLDLLEADEVVSSDRFSDEVAAQRAAAHDIGVDDLPHIVVENSWSISGLHSQDGYVQALAQIHREWTRQD